MQYREIGGIKTSLLGFGCMRFPTLPDGEINEELAEKMLDLAHERGVTYFDTAWGYHNMKSEKFLGSVLKKYPRDSFTVATKLPVWLVKSREDAERIFRTQLENVGVDHFDFYLFHSLRASTWETIKSLGLIEMFEKFRAEGKIRKLGFSFHDSYSVFEEIITAHNWDFCQIQFNYMDLEHQAGLRGLRLAESRGVSVVVMEPIRGGNLVTYSDDIVADFRAASPDRSLASWALSFVAGFKNIKCVLSGMSDMAQTEENIEIMSNFKPLSDEETEALMRITEKIRARVRVPCTGCRYCMPCPFGVDIPGNFSMYNDFSMYNNERAFRSRYASLGDKSADKCRACGACVEKCPQKIPVFDFMKEISGFISSDK